MQWQNLAFLYLFEREKVLIRKIISFIYLFLYSFDTFVVRVLCKKDALDELLHFFSIHMRIKIISVSSQTHILTVMEKFVTFFGVLTSTACAPARITENIDNVNTSRSRYLLSFNRVAEEDGLTGVDENE